MPNKTHNHGIFCFSWCLTLKKEDLDVSKMMQQTVPREQENRWMESLCARMKALKPL